MKNFIIVLIAFGVVGCGYEDRKECVLKEQQKCGGGCANEAYLYCNAEFPPAKAERELKKSGFGRSTMPAFNTLEECIDKTKSTFSFSRYKAKKYCLSNKVLVLEDLRIERILN